MNVWFTSDLHIGHRKVAASRIQFGDKPAFDDLDNLPEWFGEYDISAVDRILAEKWEDAVKPDDLVWILGDLSSGAAEAQYRALQWLRNRPGRKRLILGNHDGPHPMHRDSASWMKVYENAGVFEEAPQMAARRRIPLRGMAAGGDEVATGHVDLLLSHFPYIGDRGGVDRHEQWRLRDCGTWLLHGHTHSVCITKDYLHPRQIHVGVDAWNGRPVSLDRITDYINEREGRWASP